MDQTPAGGWNQILELDWYILWGFDGGIGYLFNEDTRFAEFDLETSASAKVFPARQDITYTLYVPTITASCSIVTDLTEVKITPYKPDIVVSYVHIAATTMNWLATEGGIEDRKSTTVLCSPSPCIIPANAIPTGFSMANASLAPIGIGDTIANGDTIYIYPDVDNIGVALSGNLRIDNSNSGYSDYDTIALSQDATILAPTVFVYMDGNNPTETGFGAIMNGSMVAGEYTVDITFWVNDTRYSSVEIVPIHYRVEINSGSDDCSGWIPNVHDEVYNYPTITLNHAANVGDIVKVYIRGVIPQDETVIITPLSILWREVKITIIPISGVIISQCSASVVSFNFDYDEDSRAEAIAKGDQTVITGLPMAKIVSMPSWVTIWSELYSHALYQDDTIINGETLTLYPTSTNSGYTPIPGSGNDYIVLASTYDSTVKVIIAVNQDANSTLPPGQVPLPAGVAVVHNNSTDYLTIIDNAYSIFGLSLSTYISYSFKGIRNALYGYGDYINIYYRVDITRGGSTFTDSFGVISGIQNSQDTDNYYPFAGDVTLASSTLGGDIVTLYLSIYSF
jgi:hypothetical protein